MSSKVLIIYEYQILFELLNEIKENFSFKLINSDNKHFDNLQFEPNTNYLIFIFVFLLIIFKSISKSFFCNAIQPLVLE